MKYHLSIVAILLIIGSVGAAHVRVSRTATAAEGKLSVPDLLKSSRLVGEKLKISSGDIDGASKIILDIENQIRSLHPQTETGRKAQHIVASLLEKGETIVNETFKKLLNN